MDNGQKAFKCPAGLLKKKKKLMMESVTHPEDETMHAVVPLEMQDAGVAVVPYKMGGCGEYRTAAYQFRTHECTIKNFL